MIVDIVCSLRTQDGCLKIIPKSFWTLGKTSEVFRRKAKGQKEQNKRKNDCVGTFLESVLYTKRFFGMVVELRLRAGHMSFSAENARSPRLAAKLLRPARCSKYSQRARSSAGRAFD